MTDSPPSGQDSLFILLIKLLFSLSLVVLPFVIPVYLPPALVVVYWLATHLAEWIENRISGAVGRTFIWMLGGCFGMSGLVAGHVPGIVMGALAGVACFLGLLALHEGWKKLARLTIQHGPTGPRITKADPVPFSGPNAWSGTVLETPEGETVRVLSWSEFVMGGPAICDYLLPDGSVILSGGASSGFSLNGRYFVTPAPSRDDWPLLIYDRHRRILHNCDVGSRFWEIDLVGNMTVSGRESPIVSNQDPHGHISVSGEDSGLLMSMKYPVVIWRDDGLAFVCKAMPENGGEKGWWLWSDLKGWNPLQSRQNLSANTPHGEGCRLIDLDARYLVAEWRLLQPRLGKGNIGELDSYTASALEIDGQVFEQPVMRQIIPLAPDGNEDERVESAPLRNWQKLVWRFRRIDEDISRHVYQCEFQGHPLEGEWLLDHRISTDGRYLALVAYAAPPAVPHQIAIFDSETGKLAWVTKAFFFPELQGFDDRRLHLVHVAERRIDALPDGLDAEVYKTLGKPNEAMVDLQITPPPSDHSRAFMRRDNQTRLRYRRTSIVLENGTWRPELRDADSL